MPTSWLLCPTPHPGARPPWTSWASRSRRAGISFSTSSRRPASQSGERPGRPPLQRDSLLWKKIKKYRDTPVLDPLNSNKFVLNISYYSISHLGFSWCKMVTRKKLKLFIDIISRNFNLASWHLGFDSVKNLHHGNSLLSPACPLVQAPVLASRSSQVEPPSPCQWLDRVEAPQHPAAPDQVQFVARHPIHEDPALLCLSGI